MTPSEPRPEPRPEARVDVSAGAAVVESLKRLFEPGSIAVFGAGEHPGTPGYQLVANLSRSGFTGPVLPINPHAEYVCGLPAVPSIADAPYPVDLAVVAVPADAVEQVVRDCAAAGVRSLVIISAGFAEAGPDGAARQQRVMSVARAAGMRVVGPNCLGIANTAPGVSMNVTFTSAELAVGSIGVMTQSGAVGIALADGLASRGLGVSSFASVGNKADVSGNDLLQFWEQDDATHQIVLYLESFGNPRSFARIAPRVARSKPVLAIKSGRSAVASAAASAHTAALALPDDAVGALLRQAGVLRVDDVEDLLDLCVALDRQPLPDGRRVAIITNGGGPGVLAADAAEAEGLLPACFEAATSDVLRSLLGEAGQVDDGSGIIDLRADVPVETLRQVLHTVMGDRGSDAVVVICTDLSGMDLRPVIGALNDLQEHHHDKPLLCCLVPPRAFPDHGALATYSSPERAVRTLARLVERADWLSTAPVDPNADPLVSAPNIRALIDEVQAASPGGGWMAPVDAFRLLIAAGIPAAMPQSCDSADAACDAATALGYPVALKVVADGVLHKSDVGGVKLGLKNDFELAAAFAVFQQHFAGTMRGAVVQPMSHPGVELLAGVTGHPELGPVVVIGEGGRLAELREDRAVRLPPLDHAAALRQVASLRIATLLDGFRGSPPSDRDAVADALVRLSQLADVVPELAELDINPLIAGPHGVCAVDVRALLRPRPAPPTGTQDR